MKMLIQRVTKASVSVRNQCVGEIEKGACIFLGVEQDDTELESRWLAQKLATLRFFEDENGKMNRSLEDVHGQVLVISQFTLAANCLTGRRPSFTQAAPPERAEFLYKNFINHLTSLNLQVATGIFRETMQISLVNDGPVTFLIEKKSNS